MNDQEMTEFSQEYLDALNQVKEGALALSQYSHGRYRSAERRQGSRSYARIARATAEHHCHHEPLFTSPMTSFNLRRDPLCVIASNPHFHRDYPIFVRRGIGHIASTIVAPGLDLIQEWFGVPSSTAFANATARALGHLTRLDPAEKGSNTQRHVRRSIQTEWLSMLLGEIERVGDLDRERVLSTFLRHVSTPPRSCVIEVESTRHARIVWNGKTFGGGYGLYIRRPREQFIPRGRADSKEVLLFLDSPWYYCLRVEEMFAGPAPQIHVGIFQDSAPVNEPRSDILFAPRMRAGRALAVPQ